MIGLTQKAYSKGITCRSIRRTAYYATLMSLTLPIFYSGVAISAQFVGLPLVWFFSVSNGG
jgi:hypothetical protein